MGIRQIFNRNDAVSAEEAVAHPQIAFAAWHSDCILHFAAIESAIGAMLADIAREDPVLVPKNAYTLGGKVKALSANISTGSAFAEGRKSLRKRLTEIEPMLPLRNILCHAHGQVLESGEGGWVWVFEHRPDLKNDQPARGWIDNAMAAEKLKSLQSHRQSIERLLENWRQPS